MDKSRAIIPKHFRQCGLLPSLMIKINFGNFGLFKGHNSKVLHGIWLVIELARDILPTNMFTKFDDYTMKTIEVIEQTNALDAGRCTCSHNTSHMITP